MKAQILLLFVILFSFSAQAQFTEDFSDGNFTDNPTWQGDIASYVVNASTELQNMDAAGNSTYLSVPILTADSTTWEFYFRLDFAPSTSNQMRAYLNASQANLNGALDGYFLQVGASGSDDALEFRRQDGAGSTLLLSTPAGSAANNPEIRVRITRNDDQVWTLFADLSGGNNFQSYGTIMDATHPQGAWFGFSNKYTSTRTDKFFFDDIKIGPLFVDTTPPELVSLNMINATTVQLQFNEPLDPTSVENLGNYNITPAATITNATLDNADPSLIILTLQPLTSGTTYTLIANGISDVEGNIATAQSDSFLFVETVVAQPNDILINEIMADPAPIIGLPGFEFVELHNRSAQFINLENFTIADASSNADPFPSFVLAPGAYVIVCDAEDVAAFTGFGEVIGVDDLPAFNNSEDRISLFNENDILIHTVRYFDEWYRDAEKAMGGWTLELINPNLFCLGSENWIASNDSDGGTPGRVNSVLDDTPDTTPPTVVSATPVSNMELTVLFSETMSEVSVENPASYRVTPGNLTPVSATIQAGRSRVNLTFSTPFIDQQDATVTVTNVSDCVGNSIDNNNTADFTFFITETAERYDIIINEIYGDPTPSHGLPELEYVELFNRSSKAINLLNYSLDEGSSTPSSFPFFVLRPGGYVILQKSDFNNFNAFGEVIELSNFALSNSGETLVLTDHLGNTIDAVAYDDDWYFDGRDDGGYSLERINPDQLCNNDRTGWSSSFADVGGTPGTVNNILNQDNVDETGPMLTKVYMDRIAANTVVLSFDEALNPMDALDLNNYTITPSSVTVSAARLTAPLFNEVQLQLNTAIEPGIIYDLKINMNMADCRNNTAATELSGRFAFSENIEAGDLVLNEILHNPYTSGSRFIELYNPSEKVMDVADLFLAKRLGLDSIGFDVVVETPCLIFPGDYLVLTPKPEDILERYTVENPNALVQAAVPSYDDQEDQVVLLTLGSVVVDELAYTREFHNALLDDRNGVSLERVNQNASTQNIGNWHSAAATVGFATPTYQNSQFSDRTSIPEGGQFISLSETTLSPDGDGFQDALTIAYTTPISGFLANIRIYDARGRLVKQLNRQTILAAEGTLKWDGSTDDEEKARLGIYVLVAEFTHPNGTVQQDKATIVVAGRLE